MKSTLNFIFFLLITLSTFSYESIVIAKGNSELSNISSVVLQKAYERIGYKVIFVDRPVKRALRDSIYGIIDGDIHRSKKILEKLDDLLIIDVPINYFELRIFSKKYDIFIEDKKQLSNYRIGCVGGFLVMEKYLKGLNTVYSKDMITNFRKLDRERVDFSISSDVEGLYYINNYFPNIKMLNPTLETVYLYHCVYKDNEFLIPKLTKVLMEMEKNGEIQKIRENYLKK